MSSVDVREFALARCRRYGPEAVARVLAQDDAALELAICAVGGGRPWCAQAPMRRATSTLTIGTLGGAPGLGPMTDSRIFVLALVRRHGLDFVAQVLARDDTALERLRQSQTKNQYWVIDDVLHRADELRQQATLDVVNSMLARQ